MTMYRCSVCEEKVGLDVIPSSNACGPQPFRPSCLIIGAAGSVVAETIVRKAFRDYERQRRY
jgi:hypothetical protein